MAKNLDNAQLKSVISELEHELKKAKDMSIVFEGILDDLVNMLGVNYRREIVAEVSEIITSKKSLEQLNRLEGTQVNQLRLIIDNLISSPAVLERIKRLPEFPDGNNFAGRC